MARVEFQAPIPMAVLTTGALAIANDAVVYSESWVLIRRNFFGVEVQFSSDTDVNVKIELEQSNVRPEVQGSFSSNFVVGIDPIGTVTDENVNIFPVAPIVSVYARFKLTGLNVGSASNSATTVLERANWVEAEA